MGRTLLLVIHESNSGQFLFQLEKLKNKRACKNICLNVFCDKNKVDFLSDVSVSFLNKTDPSNPLKRKNYWKYILQTFAPNGLNIAYYVQHYHHISSLFLATAFWLGSTSYLVIGHPSDTHQNHSKVKATAVVCVQQVITLGIKTFVNICI